MDLPRNLILISNLFRFRVQQKDRGDFNKKEFQNRSIRRQKHDDSGRVTDLEP